MDVEDLHLLDVFLFADVLADACFEGGEAYVDLPLMLVVYLGAQVAILQLRDVNLIPVVHLVTAVFRRTIIQSYLRLGCLTLALPPR